METTLRKPENFSMQRKRTSKGTRKGCDVLNSWATMRVMQKCHGRIERCSNKFDNNDPCINRSVHVKLSLVDLEAYSESHGDKAQAILGCAA
jgi:hypothetical protein